LPLKIFLAKAWDFVTHYTQIDAWLPKNIVVVNQRAFDGLSAETQAGAAAEARGADHHSVSCTGYVFAKCGGELRPLRAMVAVFRADCRNLNRTAQAF